jgi:hypothetical protein
MTLGETIRIEELKSFSFVQQTKLGAEPSSVCGDTNNYEAARPEIEATPP